MVNIYRVHSFHCVTEKIISSCITSSDDGRVVFITPESSKASVERIVMETIREHGLSTVSGYDGDNVVNSSFVEGDVLSFIRLAVRMLDMCGITSGSSSDKIVMRNAIYRVLVDHHKEFHTFGKFIGRFEYIDSIIDLLGDFRRYNIDDDTVSKAYELAEDAGDDAVYSDKLHDLKLLSMYLDELGKEYSLPISSDPISEAVKLLRRLSEDPLLKDKNRYRALMRFLSVRFSVIGFGNVRILTPQETELIRYMSLLGADISFYPIFPSEEIPEEGRDTVYANAGAFVDVLTANVDDVFIHDFPETDDTHVPSLELRAAVRSYALRMPPDKDVKTSDIKAVSIDGIDDTVGYIANEIIRLTRHEGYRYKDIRIVCVDESVKNDLKGVMGRFGLDMFVDRKIVIDNTPVFRYISALSELPIRDFELNDLLRTLRTGLAGIRLQDVDLFENYCIKYNITSGRRIFDREYYVAGKKYVDKISIDGEVIPVCEYLWEHIVERVLIPLRETAVSIYNEKTISGKAKILAEHTDSLASTVRYMAKELSERGDTDRASALVRGYSEVMSLLVQFMTPMNDVEADQQVFSSLIRIDMRNKVQGTIPLMVDSVEIVSLAQAYITPCRVIFLAGAKADNFPYSKVNEGIMTSGELLRFSRDSGIELPDKVQSRNKSDFIASALMFGTVKDKLYIMSGEEKTESSAFKHFKQYSSKILVNCFKTMIYGSPVTRRHNFETASIDPEIMQGILDDHMSISVSSLETYNTCRFQYMLKQILKIREREKGTAVQSNDMGTIIHHMFEVALKDAVRNIDTPEGLTEYASMLRNDEARLRKLAEESFLSYCNESEKKYERTPEFAVNPGRKAMRLFEYVFPIVLEEAGSSGYVPSDFEMKIADIRPPLSIDTPSGKVFDFVGYIDRIDTDPETGMMRIIDYKTGNKSIDYKKTLAGLQTQLYAYSNAVKAEGKEVEAVGYLEIGMKVETGKPLDIKPKISKLEKADFDDVSAYVDWLMRKSCEDITEGRADALVNSLCGTGKYSACGYCPYSGSCGNDPMSPKTEVKGYVKYAENPKRPTQSEIIAEMNERRGSQDGSVT